MKMFFNAALLLVCSSAYAGEPSVRAAVMEKLKDAYTYKVPAAASQEAEPSQTSGNPDVIHLEPYQVNGSLERLDLARDFDHKAEMRAAKTFTLGKGGLIFTSKSGNAEFGIWTSLVPSSFPMANYPILRVDFLHLRW